MCGIERLLDSLIRVGVVLSLIFWVLVIFVF